MTVSDTEGAEYMFDDTGSVSDTFVDKEVMGDDNDFVASIVKTEL